MTWILKDGESLIQKIISYDVSTTVHYKYMIITKNIYVLLINQNNPWILGHISFSKIWTIKWLDY